MTKVFTFLITSQEEDVAAFGQLAIDMLEEGITITKEDGNQKPFDSEPIGYSFTGDEEKIRRVLANEWFPDYINDAEWADVEKVKV